MRILLDECLPRRLKAHLVGHDCQTVGEAGWAGKKNGELLRLADGSYDVFLTLDRGIQYQQNLSGQGIAVVILQARSNRLEDLLQLVPVCLTVLNELQPGQIISAGDRSKRWGI
jgi:hypothetical protein